MLRPAAGLWALWSADAAHMGRATTAIDDPATTRQQRRPCGVPRGVSSDAAPDISGDNVKEAIFGRSCGGCLPDAAAAFAEEGCPK